MSNFAAAQRQWDAMTPADDDEPTAADRRAARAERLVDLAECPDGNSWQSPRYRTLGEILLPDGTLPPYKRSTHPDDYV